VIFPKIIKLFHMARNPTPPNYSVRLINWQIHMINQSGSKNTSASIWPKNQSEDDKQVLYGDKMSSL